LAVVEVAPHGDAGREITRLADHLMKTNTERKVA
jgi:hypothetical protein